MSKIGFYNLCFEFGRFVDVRSNLDKKKVLARVSIRVSMLVFRQVRVGLEFMLCARFWVINIELRLGLGYKALVFASTTNLESGPRFADICLKP